MEGEKRVSYKCKCRDRVFKVIVDGGSIDNLVNTETMQKLQLTCIPKPHPYSISWLKKDHSVLVNQTCLVNFKIGPYEDKVWCDVVPMDACHVLLGRPWQYDRDVIHQGKENKYELCHGNRCHILKPFEEGSTESTTLSLSTMGWKRFSKDSRSGVFYLLYP